MAKPSGRLELPRRIKPGSELVRTWKGKSHRVRVLTDGFAYDGETFASLSEIASEITGTRWNAADRILLVDPEDAVFIGVERHRLAMALQISSGRRKIIEGALALDKLQMHQPAGGIGDIDEQGALRPAALEPPVLRSIWISSPMQSRR